MITFIFFIVWCIIGFIIYLSTKDIKKSRQLLYDEIMNYQFKEKNNEEEA